MKWFSFLFVICATMTFISPHAAFTESDKSVIIKSISHSKSPEAKEQETITFKMDAAVVAKIFTIGGEKPRLVIDFPESIYWGKNVITLPDGLLASTIRIGLHRTPVERTRVVVDLAKEMEVQYTSDYLEEENSLIVTLSPGTTKKQALPSLGLQEKAPVEPAEPSTLSPSVPTILEVSFDDSSSKGEMVLFRLNDFYPPSVSAIEKDTPRVLCDFMAMNLGPNVQETILANGKYIERIRTARHQNPDKVRIVLDLSPNRDYDLQQVFFKNGNLFVLIVNELAAGKDAEQVK